MLVDSEELSIGVPYKIVVFKADDPSDLDWMNAHELKAKRKGPELKGSALREFLEHYVSNLKAHCKHLGTSFCSSLNTLWTLLGCTRTFLRSGESKFLYEI